MKTINKITLFLFAFFGIIISFLDFTGWLTDIQWLQGKIPATSLLLLSGATLYIAFEAPEKASSQHSELMDAIKQIDLLGGRVRIFKDTDECIRYTKHRISYAKTKTSGVYADMGFDFINSIPQGILYREVLIIEDTSQPHWQSLVQTRKNSQINNFTCGIFQPKNGVHFQCVIIDSSEVIFLSKLSANNLSITHPQLVYLIQYYFDEIDRRATRRIR